MSPAAALEARLAGVDAAVRRLLGEEWIGSAEAAEAADLAARAAAAVQPAGRAMAAANAGLPVPEEPHLALWQSVTTLREYRGDGHNAALLEREIDGVSAHVWPPRPAAAPREWLMRARGWEHEDWEAAAQR